MLRCAMLHHAVPQGIWLCLTILSRALGGNYVNFGVFELYGDPALKVGRGGAGGGAARGGAAKLHEGDERGRDKSSRRAVMATQRSKRVAREMHLAGRVGAEYT